MEEVWIIGMGRFGSMAFQRLSASVQNRHFILVDPVEANLLKFKGPTTTLEISDGVAFLNTHLRNSRKPDWIIPALPVHLAAEWILVYLGTKRLRRIPPPSHIEMMIPNAIIGTEGNIYASHADFRCPDDCDEPRGICSVTRKKRKKDMFDLMRNLDIEPYKALNIRSYQLGPGIGGYRPEQLTALVETVKQARGPILLSTACRCHGVITALERI